VYDFRSCLAITAPPRSGAYPWRSCTSIPISHAIPAPRHLRHHTWFALAVRLLNLSSDR
jgi:hypothetical protein